MTVKQILAMKPQDILNISSVKELRSIANTLASAANKRIKRIEKENIVSPAVQKVEKSQGIPRFSIANKNEVGLKNIIAEMKSFLGDKTSNVKGARTWQKNVKTALEKQLNIKIPDNRFADFFDTFSRLRDIMPEAKLRSMKYNTMETIAEYMTEHPRDSIDEIVAKMQDVIRNEYEKQTHNLSDISGTGNFFDF